MRLMTRNSNASCICAVLLFYLHAFPLYKKDVVTNFKLQELKVFVRVTMWKILNQMQVISGVNVYSAH